jgi:hypothetical protein
MTKPASPKKSRKISAAFSVSFAPHPTRGEIAPVVVSGFAPGAGETTMTAERIIDVLPDVLARARKDAAELLSEGRRRAVKESELTFAAVDLVPESIGLPADVERVRYFCNGIHPDDGGGWSDWATGICLAEAEVHARWMMALNGEDFPPSDPDDLDSFIGAMQDSEIDYMAKDPVTKDELSAAAARLISGIGGSTGPAYDEIVQMLEKLDVSIDRPTKRM